MEEALARPYSILYAAAGSLAYGGELHGLMAGTVFAGTGRAVGLSLGDCGPKLPVRRAGSRLTVELYYVEPEQITLIGEELGKRVTIGIERATVTVEAAGLTIPAETHVAGCSPLTGDVERSFIRLLLALPHGIEPPAEPLTAIPAVLKDAEVCGDAFCPRHGSTVEAVVVDVYLHVRRLREWLRAPLGQLIARDPAGLRLYVHAPVRGVEG